MVDKPQTLERRKIKAEVLGLAAGAVLIASNLPVLLEQLADPGKISNGELLSRVAMIAGNALWIASGMICFRLSIVVVCTIQCLLLLLVVLLAVFN